MGTNQSIIYYSGLLKARESIESISIIYFKMLRIIFFLSLIVLALFTVLFNESIINEVFKSPDSFSLIYF